MLEPVDVGVQCIGCYATNAGGEAVAQLRELAAPLAGARVLHLNATPDGGGVAGLKQSETQSLPAQLLRPHRRRIALATLSERELRPHQKWSHIDKDGSDTTRHSHVRRLGPPCGLCGAQDGMVRPHHLVVLVVNDVAVPHVARTGRWVK
jgi:hypothetical protein